MALKNDGTVWVWGQNNHGQLGDGTNETRTAPVKVSGLSNVIAISGSAFNSMALKSDGTVWAWGYNGSGLLGDGTTEDYKTIPVKVSGLSNVISIGSGIQHNLALKNDGTVRTWGNNFYGQLGNGVSGRVNKPIYVFDLSKNMPPLSGSIHLIIEPHGAVTSGAQWRVDGGQWHDSDETLMGLSIGEHSLEFKPLNGWEVPLNQDFIISVNQTLKLTASYLQDVTSDSDKDGIPDVIEAIACSDAYDADSDDDGLQDGLEDSNLNGIKDEKETDPCQPDSDFDGINDYDERMFWGDDWNKDYDGDGLINILDSDADDDGVKDGREIRMGSDPSDDSSRLPVSLLPGILNLLL